MAGFNVYLMQPEIVRGPPRRLKAKVYLRERPDDLNPGNELNMGMPAQEFILGSGAFNSQNAGIRASIRAAVTTMYGISIDDRDLLTPPHKATGLNRFFNSKEWNRVKA